MMMILLPACGSVRTIDTYCIKYTYVGYSEESIKYLIENDREPAVETAKNNETYLRDCDD